MKKAVTAVGASWGAALALCLRCKIVPYCSKDYQAAHWRRDPGGHKQFYLTQEQRTPAAAQKANPKELSHQRAMYKVIVSYKRDGGKGSTLAQYNLGVMYRESIGIPEVYKEAMR
jgi:hypothetical protein